jgi:hypothetical protein
MDRFAASKVAPLRVHFLYLPEQTEVKENVAGIDTLVPEMAFCGPRLTKDWPPCLIPRNA